MARHIFSCLLIWLSLLYTAECIQEIDSDNPPDVYVKPDETNYILPGQFRSMYKRWRSYRRSNVTILDTDIRLTPTQFIHLYDSDGGRVSKRKAERDVRRRWTDNTMPYEFADNVFSDHEKEEMRIAMDELSRFTCLKFRPKRDGDKHWVKFQDNRSGCNSALGMSPRPGGQALNLDASGCRWRGLYLHEIGHALGLIHEHQRPDRDNHIKVIWRRVQSDYLHAFTKYKEDSVVDFGIEYDLSSIMHYGQQGFSDNYQVTVEPLERWKYIHMVRVYFKTLSWTDTKILNQMYNCAAHCTNTCSGGEYLDKDCKCVSPKDIHDALCVNELSDDECHNRVKQGQCTIGGYSGETNIKCRKACGACPMYGLDAQIRPKAEANFRECINRYHDDGLCDKWAAEGSCDKYPSWMKRYCRKSCNACDWHLGSCRNMHQGLADDVTCDNMAANGECSEDKVKVGCPDSCGTCGFQMPGDCSNTGEQCDAKGAAGWCDHPTSMVDMFNNCKKTCNTCLFNEGKCENELPDAECDEGAILGKCRIEPPKYKKGCKKACNSCKYGTEGACDNVWDDQDCYWFGRDGTCDDKKGYAYNFCPKTCNTCEYAQGDNCENVAGDEECDGYVKRNQCALNPIFMNSNCAKACGTCHKIKYGACENLHYDLACEAYKKRGHCTEKVHYMRKNCRRSCGFCEAPPIVVPNVCENIAGDGDCEPWAERGECKSNPSWMSIFCSKSCDTCA